jgi:mono/diheme cytochrome c family protein
MNVVRQSSLGLMFAVGLGLGMSTAVAQQQPGGAMQAAPPAMDAGAGKTVWDGVYTDAQAEAGKAVVSANCAVCHGSSLTGGETGPPLTGGVFMARWENMTLADVFDFMSTQMPLGNPGSLSDGDYLKALARILQANKFPAGDTDLKSDHDTLAQIKVTKQTQ